MSKTLLCHQEIHSALMLQNSVSKYYYYYVQICAVTFSLDLNAVLLSLNGDPTVCPCHILYLLLYQNILRRQLFPECLTLLVLDLQLVDLIFRHHRVAAEVGHHLGPAAGAEADR